MIVEINTRTELPRVGRKKQFTIVANELIEQIQNQVLKIKNQIYLTNSNSKPSISNSDLPYEFSTSEHI